jgi:hypothetical protein
MPRVSPTPRISHARLQARIPLATATGRATGDITADLRGTLAPRTTKGDGAVTDPAKVAELLRAIDWP